MDVVPIVDAPVEFEGDDHMAFEKKDVKAKYQQDVGETESTPSELTNNLAKRRDPSIHELPNEHLIEKENYQINADGTTYTGQMKVVSTVGQPGSINLDTVGYDSQE